MKYMMLIASDESAWDATPEEEINAIYQRIGEWWGEQGQAGRVTGGHELQPTATATTVRIAADGATTVTDGPFIEGKEAIGGYGILEVADLDEAIAVASSWPHPGATLELRPIVKRD